METFGLLTVVEKFRRPSKRKSRGKTEPVARLVCECGTEVIKPIDDLKKGRTLSCGCLKSRKKVTDPIVLKRKRMLASVKSRAKKEGIEFNLELEDIVIPEFCPLLGIKLCLDNTNGDINSSPSVDKLIPSKGYTKGNVIVISHRANTIKSNASIDEIMLLADNLHAILMEETAD